MQRSTGVALIAVLIAIAAPVRAQTTVQRAADVLNRPQPNPVVETRRVTTTTIIVPQREVVVIERVHDRRYGWWKHPQYRVITVYYDGSRFYRRPFGRVALRKVVVYERGGHYYIDEGQWRRDHRRYYGRDYDGWKDDDGRRDDDKYKDDDKRNDDDKRRDDDDHDGPRGNHGHHYGQDPDKHNDKH
jgi:hypothetical protein